MAVKKAKSSSKNKKAAKKAVKKPVKKTVKKAVKKTGKKTAGKGKKFTKEELFPLIQKRAFQLWKQAGKPFGNDWEFWFKAEKEIKAKYGKK